MAKKPLSDTTQPSKQKSKKQGQTQGKAPAFQEYDSPWKEIIELFFPQFMAFFFPVIAEAIDWSKPVEFLDKEFQRSIRRSEIGRQTVDKLVKVWLLTGAEVWVLIHIEVQSQKENDFNTRMYIYRYRIFDRYRRPILSLAIIGDNDPEWRPDRYETELLGNKESLQFGMVKLLDYEIKWAELEQNLNPFAVVVMAHLKALATQNKDQERFFWKKTLIRELYKRQYNKQDIFNLFRFLDWVMKLPEVLETQIQLAIDEYEEEHKMRYVTSIERMAMERGEREGQEKGEQRGRVNALSETVVRLLQHRFMLTEEASASVTSLLQPVQDEPILTQIIDLTLDARTFDDFIAKLQLLLPPTAKVSASDSTPESL
jgi:hypothetical protein